MNEYTHLINDYLCVNRYIQNNGFFAITADELNKALHNLVPFDRPDMYAVLDGKIVILEHFQFDASQSKRKSMLGLREEALLEKKMMADPLNTQLNIEKVDYKKSFQDWQKNFERCFSEHYSRIGKYKENILARTGVDGQNITVGFLIECELTPYVMIDRDIGILPYVLTTQFVDVFRNSEDLDFVLYAYLDQKPRLIYLDHCSLQNMQTMVDLNDERITLAKLNDNEVVLYGGFEIEY